MKKAFYYILGFDPYNEQICKSRIKGKYNNITHINVCARTEGKIDKDKEQSYEDLQTVVDKVPKSYTVIILGALSAKLGKEGVYSNVTGKHTLREETNRNGEMLFKFSFANSMIIMNTQFQHKFTKQPPPPPPQWGSSSL